MINKIKNSKIFKLVEKRFSALSFTEIFIIVSVFIALYLIIKFFSIKQEWRTIKIEIIRKNWKDNYDVYAYKTPYWLSDKLKVNQVEINKSGSPIAKIINIENFERGGEETDTYVTLQVKAIHNKKADKYLFKDKFYLDVGAPIEFNINNTQVLGQIIDNNVPPEGSPVTYMEVTFRAQHLKPWQVNQIKTGDKIHNLSTNEVIMEFLDVKIEEPIADFLELNGIRYAELKDNQFKDVVIKAKVKCTTENGRLYFAGHQNIKISNSIWVFGDKINLNGLEIMDMKKI